MNIAALIKTLAYLMLNAVQLLTMIQSIMGVAARGSAGFHRPRFA